MRRSLVLAALGASLALPGCAVTATQIYGRDGDPYQYIECRGMWRTLEDCYQKASLVCPSGYRIENDVAPRDAFNSSLIVRCK